MSHFNDPSARRIRRRDGRRPGRPGPGEGGRGRRPGEGEGPAGGRAAAGAAARGGLAAGRDARSRRAPGRGSAIGRKQPARAGQGRARAGGRPLGLLRRAGQRLPARSRCRLAALGHGGLRATPALGAGRSGRGGGLRRFEVPQGFEPAALPGARRDRRARRGGEPARRRVRRRRRPLERVAGEHAGARRRRHRLGRSPSTGRRSGERGRAGPDGGVAMAADSRENALREQSMGALFKELSEDLSTLVRQELRLAQAEMTEKGKLRGHRRRIDGGRRGHRPASLWGALTACLIAAARDRDGKRLARRPHRDGRLRRCRRCARAERGKNRVAEAAPPAPNKLSKP